MFIVMINNNCQVNLNFTHKIIYKIGAGHILLSHYDITLERDDV